MVMSDWKARDKSVDEAIEKIEFGLMIMNPFQMKGVRDILSIVWMDGSCDAMGQQLKSGKDMRLNPDE
jgi:hypothetical protein